MITIKKSAETPAKPKELTIEELHAGIADSLKKTGGNVSGDRLHSVDSHLRACIRTLGFKPRERTEAGKVTTTVTDLLGQLQACLDNTTEVTERQFKDLHLHLKATHSNCAAEVGAKLVPELREVPATGAALQQQQQQPGNVAGNELMSKKYNELIQLVEELNADPARTEKITVPGNTSKLSLANLILKAKGLPPLLAMIAAFLSLFFLDPSALASQTSFNFTNIVPGAYTVTSWPTNTVTTNYWSTGTNTWQTNQFQLCWQTGNAIPVDNYNLVGFDFSCNYTSSNAATVAIELVRGSGPAGVGGPPQVVINTNTSTIWNNGYETTVANQYWLLFTLPAGTNLAFNWRTNIDVSGADYLGIYQETNNISLPTGAIGWMSNIVASINKKIIPVSLSGGNY